MNLLLAPHQDDETLFAAYTALRYQPLIVFCTMPKKHEADGITAARRLAEARQAAAELRCSCLQLVGQRDDMHSLDETLLRKQFERQDAMYQPQRIWAPAPELGGHEHHTQVGQVASEVFGYRVRHYMTYVRGQGRSTGSYKVEVTPTARKRKAAAMACYASQAAHPATAYWFADESNWWEEWLA